MGAVTQLVGEVKRHTGLAWAERRVRRNARNASYSILDYVSQPVAMILAAPLLLRTLGVSQYGIWMIVMAVVGSLGLLGSGFGDATVKYVAEFRGKGDADAVERVIRSTLTINSVLAVVFGAAVWMAAPFAATRVFKVEPGLLDATIWSLRIAAFLLVLRSVESVFISTLRAFEDYGATVRVSLLTRLSTVVLAVVLSLLGYGVFAIMVGSVVISATGVLLQSIAVHRVAGRITLLPSLHTESLSAVFAFGSFSWLQAVATVALMHADRLLVGAYLGTAAVAYYTICVQVAQPIHGLSAAALNFIFPNIAARLAKGDIAGARKTFRFALFANIAVATVVAIPLAVFSRPLLGVWMGMAFASTAGPVLSILAVAYATLAVNVTGHYTLLALGRVKYVSALNVIGGILTLGLAVFLVGWIGLVGAAIARLAYGPITLLYYRSVGRNMREHPAVAKEQSVSLSPETVEGTSY